MLIRDIEPIAQSFNVPPTEFYGGRGGTQDTYVKNRDILDIIIDIPCLETCRYLFDCNILTLASSANKNDLSTIAQPRGFVTIDFNSLDDANKKVVQELASKGYIELDDIFEKRRIFNIEVSFYEDTTVEDFSNRMLALAHHFQPQQVLYGCYSSDDFKEYVAKKAPTVVTLEGENFCDVLLSRMNSGEISNDPNGEIEFYDGRCISFETLCQEYAKEFRYFYDPEERTFWIDEELFDKAQNVKKELQSSGVKK